MSLDKTLLIIQGPTAIGKTGLSIKLAQELSCDIISADSRQVFKEMHIGTARPVLNELQGVAHHLLGHKSIFDSYNAETYAQDARAIITDLFKDNDIVILVGGSGFYVNSVLYEMDNIPDIPENFRLELNEELGIKGLGNLQDELKLKDPEYFDKVDISNSQRLIRALEVIRYSGKSFSSFHSGRKLELPYKIINFALNQDREKLYKKINLRVDEMILKGLEEEARGLHQYKNLNALQTVGYNEMFEFFEGKIDFDICKESIKRNTRRFAKRQLTWLRREQNIEWIDASDSNSFEEILNQI